MLIAIVQQLGMRKYGVRRMKSRDGIIMTRSEGEKDMHEEYNYGKKKMVDNDEGTWLMRN